ncbi:MAG TPA: ribonuclease H-like domain-containing protein [candidate division Zixibacteria bacterium]|nr:ribonuclease H-like domain-containing protein [candidate division Zixibacteria bacterium]
MTSSNLNEKLNRFSSLIGGAKSPADKESKHPRRYRTLAERLGGKIIDHHAGGYCLVRRLYPGNYRHGDHLLADLIGDRTLPMSAFTPLDEPGEVRLRDLLFFDTETTGLGGAGVVPFLIGCGGFVDGGFEVRQYVIPDYSDEAAMLEALLEELTEPRVVVSYNGRAFDLPIVQDRMIVNRVARKVPIGGHLDLLHAGRRLYRRRLSDCSLTNIEREIFGFYREDDIPGFLIPSIYFDWLSEEKLDQMESVLEHNRLDIVSLAFLAVHLAEIFESEGSDLCEPEDIHSLARVYGRRKDNELVTRLYDRIEQASGHQPEDDMVLYHALGFKRVGDWKRAVELWQSLANKKNRQAWAANIELAKYYEHRAGQLDLALEHTNRAADQDQLTQCQQEQTRERRKRLENKLNR